MTMAKSAILLQVLITFTLVLKTSSLFILCPLYVYPDSSTDSAWQPLYSAIEAYPNVEWQIVVNPASGPGPNSCPGSAGAAADVNYQAGIAKLNSYNNVQTLGYVWAAWGTKSISDVELEIDIYASWTDCAGADVAVDGIFFDDFVNSTTTSPQNALTVNFAQQVAAYAREKISSSSALIVFNPGSTYTSQTSEFFSYADTVIDFEGSASSYSSSGTLDSIESTEGLGNLAQSAIIIHDVPTSLDPQPWIQTMIANGVGAVYMTQDCCYNALEETFLLELAAAIAAG